MSRRSYQKIREYSEAEHISLSATYRRIYDGRLKARWQEGLMVVDPGSYRPRQRRPWHRTTSQPTRPDAGAGT